MSAKRVTTVGILYEFESDIEGEARDVPFDPKTHYHWREPEEIEAVSTTLVDSGFQVVRIGPVSELLKRHHDGTVPDLIWNLSIRSGTRSRTAISSAVLEEVGVPYTGADAVCRAVTLNKDYWKPAVQEIGVVTPEWTRFAHPSDVKVLPPWPQWILKPVCEGYSLGVAEFGADDELDKVRSAVDRWNQSFGVASIAEERVDGREVTVALVGHDAGNRLVSVSEVVDRNGGPLGKTVLDLGAKREGRFSRTVVDVSDPLRDASVKAAEKTMALFGPADYATFDFRVDEDGRVFLIDINVDATLHPRRSLAQTFAVNGVRYGDVIKQILKSALSRFGLTDEDAADV